MVSLEQHNPQRSLLDENSPTAASPAASPTNRHNTPAFFLLQQALGTREDVIRKLARLLQGAADFLDTETLDRRLARLKEKEIIDTIPTRIQLVLGGIDMIRFFISPAAADYYQKQNIHFGFHQLLRFLEDPRSLMNPLGILNSKDGIIGHLMQVVHADPDYDLQLLEMFNDGVDDLVRQLEQMLQGTHPRYHSIHAIVEESDYHGRLLCYVRAWQRREASGTLRRCNVAQDPNLSLLARTFGDLTNAMRYFSRLPTQPIPGILHLMKNRSFPPRL